MVRKPEGSIRPERSGSAGGQAASGGNTPVAEAAPVDYSTVALVGAMLGVVFVWAYRPTLAGLVAAWGGNEDYLHGFLVPPLAGAMLWMRRREFPGWESGFAWPGLVMLLSAFGVRLIGAKLNVDAIQGWSILLWIAGVVWLLGGWRVCRWAAPAIAFLWFMVPLPFQAEQSLRWELQRVVTSMSCWVLQLLGQPAVAQGNVVALPGRPLEVAEACSGMRIFMGVFAFAFAFIILTRRSWWERGLLLAGALPVALLANMARIVVLALLTEKVSPEFAAWAHEPIKVVMVLLAAVLLGLLLFYLGRLFREVEEGDVGAVVRRQDV